MTDTDLPSPAHSQRSFVFIGKDGLRAGWSLLLYLIFVAVLAAVVAGVTMGFHPPTPKAGTPQAPLPTIGGEAASFFVVAFAAFLVAGIERRPFSHYGLRAAALLPDLLKGMAWGLAMLSLLVGMLALSGVLVFDGVALGLGEALRYGGLWFVAFCLVGLFEEFLTRGFLQFTLARGIAGIVSAISPTNTYARTIGFWVAAAVFSVGLFAVGHLFNNGETAMGLVSVALAGLTFAYVLYRTGSLWWAIGFHATWDWAQSFLYGVPDSGGMMQGHLLLTHPVGATWLSGGATGPEGSVLVIPVLLLTILIIHRTLPRRATAFDA
ncbi:CPBP family intramembrane glutamic endopeptidase [Sphingomonas glacialis]|uniref:CPBP family intramembrane metalloprotease n=1 Tax=Sphingomonas glacialis TaxID=658225 RepID=A0A502G1B2_9SPHN|nr:CPBP family intramembrane glutamic endopeptidase [Sphingomonas glacialis]TPG55320.1 CPBP family intramembrane metalloprotease [Sphingomonas glacialis]